MTHRSFAALSLITSLLLPGMLRAQLMKPPVTLKPGDAAPALGGGKWLKGEPVKSFEKDKIYVVEFWATWCGPCKEAIPHVTEMQAKYKDQGVIFIGQNVWERDQALAEPFVTQMGDKMAYRVVMDEIAPGAEADKGTMARTWMDAAGEDGIPCSFLVDRQGKLAWIGHPMELERVLKQVVDGTFDLKKEAERITAMDALQARLQDAVKTRDLDKAMGVLDDFEKIDPDRALNISALRFSLLLQKKDYDAAYKIAAKIGDAPDVEPGLLNEIAWTMVDNPDIEKRDYDIAEKLASRANKITGEKDADILDTCARVQFEKGKIDAAIELETKAVEHSDANMRQQLQATLEKYKAAKPKAVGT